MAQGLVGPGRRGPDAAISIHGGGAAPQDHGFFVIMPGHRAGWTNDIYASSHQMTSPAYHNYRYSRGLSLGLTRYVTRR